MTDQSPIIVYLGPTMPVAEARAILPDAIYLPPAAQSDILTAVDAQHPAAICIIDGVFTQDLSIWHKEILYALERGVAVYGASSMGALRVAETAAFGAVGIGQIFEAFASGELTDDDEVAVMHAQDDFGHRSLSDAMVNIRATLAAALTAGVIDQQQHDELVAKAKATFFPERSFARLLADAAAAGLDDATLAALREFITTAAVDRKRLDAIALLEHVRDQGITAPPPISVTRSHPFLAQYERDRRASRNGTEVPRSDIAAYAALHLPDFAELNEAALHAALVDVLGEVLQVEPDEAAVAHELERFRADRRLRSEDDLSQWQDDNDLTDDEFAALLRRQAVRRELRSWLVSRKYLERTTAEVLEELRLRGKYPSTADAAAYQQQVLSAAHPDFEFAGDDTPLRELIREQAQETRWRPTVALDQWAFENGFKDVPDVRYELVRSRLARKATAAALESLTGALFDGPGAGADADR